MKHTLLTVLCFFATSLVAISQTSEKQLDVYLQNFQYQKALEYIDTQEVNKNMLLQKALCYKALGNYRQAVIILQSLAEEYAEDIPIKTQLALCYEALAQREQSIACYDDLIRMDSVNAYFKIQRADMLYQNGNFADALDQYRAVYKESEMPNMLKRVALCYEKMNQLDSAIVYFDEAWALDSLDSFSAASYINLALKTKRVLVAMNTSQLYVDKDTTNAQINLLNALSYYTADDYEGAAQRFEKCYARGDTSLVVNRSLGIAYYSIGESNRGIKYLENAYRQDTANMNVQYCLAMIYSELNESEKAIVLFHKLLDKAIPPPMTLFLYYRNLAIAYERNQQFENAVTYYVLALENSPSENQSMNVYYSIAQLYELFLDMNAEALLYYKKYRASLVIYLNDAKEKSDEELADVKGLQLKIDRLDEYIVRLENRMSKR